MKTRGAVKSWSDTAATATGPSGDETSTERSTSHLCAPGQRLTMSITRGSSGADERVAVRLGAET